MMITHHFSSGVYAKETRIPAGHYLVQHVHKHDHLSILAAGKIEVMVDGATNVIEAPRCLTIVAGKHHGVKALTDTIWYCIHATECDDVSKVDDVLIASSDMQVVKNIHETLGA